MQMVCMEEIQRTKQHNHGQLLNRLFQYYKTMLLGMHNITFHSCLKASADLFKQLLN